MSTFRKGKGKKGALLLFSVFSSLLMLYYTGLAMNGSNSRAAANGISVGLITDGPLNDSGFNWSAYQGLLQSQNELEVAGSVYTSTSSADFGPNLNQCVNDGLVLCLGVGFLLAETVSNTAAANPDVNFAVLDFAYDSYLPNVRGIVFEVNEAAYLAGYLAGSMSQTGVVGEIGGMEIPAVDDFILPFGRGARCASPGITTLVTYTNNFGDPALGAMVAQSQIAQGADVIFPPAGPTGSGAILTATQSGV